MDRQEIIMFLVFWIIIKFLINIRVLTNFIKKMLVRAILSLWDIIKIIFYNFMSIYVTFKLIFFVIGTILLFFEFLKYLIKILA